jgi:hypothetical protein
VSDTGTVQEIERLLSVLSGTSWSLQPDGEGATVIRVDTPGTDGVTELTVAWDGAPAGAADVTFVAHALDDAGYLLQCHRTGERPPSPRSQEIRARAEAASAGPWRAFLDSSPGVAGSSMIQLADDAGPDLYLSIGSGSAPDSYLDFVAWARTGIPALLDELEGKDVA